MLIANLPNRHDELSLNVMLLVGASYKIYEVFARCKGSMPDQKVFEESELHHLLSSENWRPFKNGLIVGDSAYKVSEKLYCPLFLGTCLLLTYLSTYLVQMNIVH